MAKTYTLNVAGLTRELTICKVNDHMDIAAFIMLGDAELTVFDILLTAEAKGIPLAHEMSRQSGKPYICARKGEKLYMADPVVVEDQSITTAGKQKLVIDRKELDKMNGKRVLVVDDVISTGGSLKALDALAEKTQCTIVGQAAVLAEGDAAERKDIIFLEPLPLFFH
jgi:adenine phosphoribosyltransferase